MALKVVPMVLQVRKLYEKEYSIEQIASKLGLSLREARYYYLECSAGIIKF